MELYQKKGEVIKSNSLIRCSGNISLLQRKAFALMLKETIEHIQTRGKKDKYLMPFSEFKRILGYESNITTKQIAKELEELIQKVIRWDIDEKGNGARATMLSYFQLEDKNIYWEFSNALLEKIFEKGFTPLQLAMLFSFSSKYALALYENLYSRKSMQKTTYTVEELRALLGAEDTELRIDNFKRKVLQPAIAELNDKSDLKIYAKDIKQGRKVVAFEFRWIVLSKEEIQEREKRKKLIEEYRKDLSSYFGKKIKIGGKLYTFTKDGFMRGGKIWGGFDLIDSYESYLTALRVGMAERLD